MLCIEPINANDLSTRFYVYEVLVATSVASPRATISYGRRVQWDSILQQVRVDKLIQVII